MPVACAIRGSVLLLTLEGEYSFDEPVRAVSAAMANPLFRPGMSLLIDARWSMARRSSEQFRERSAWMASLRPRGISSRCAIIVSSQPHQYGLARMAEAYLDLHEMALGIFTDPDKALQWLGAADVGVPGVAGDQQNPTLPT
jgi:hypothetical protein